MVSRRLIAARLLLAVSLLVGPTLMLASPASASTTTTTTRPLLGLGTTTTTTTVPASTTTSTSTSTSTTSTTVSKTSGTGVPSVPVGGPPTTVAPKGAKGSKNTPTTPTTQPSVEPIVAEVDVDLDQLTAINTYKPAQALVAKAQGKVTEAGATLLSARQSVDRADGVQEQASQAKALADTKLRQLALAAYMGVGYSTPDASGNGTEGPGTVSTPDGLTGMEAVDAQEMLIVVGQHARQDDQGAAKVLAQAGKAVQAATKVFNRDQGAVNAAEAQLLADQQTLKLITTAAITPGAATATPLSQLVSYIQSGGQKNPPATTTTTTTTTTTSNTLPGGLTPALQQATADVPNPVSPSILGTPQLDPSQLIGWWNSLGRKPNITVPIKQLVLSYAAWGQKLGVRDDVAFAQSIVETGYFSFPSYGQLTDKDNNFAGIGACDTCAHGWSFPSADTGVQAQLELLREYATNAPLPKGVKNVIGGTGVGGCCQSWTQLAGKWASSTVYGISIMTVYQQELAWLIPQKEVADGLIAPSAVTAKGPDLASLPGSKPTTSTAGSTTPTTTAPQSVSAASIHH